jgi:hypothetical protein
MILFGSYERGVHSSPSSPLIGTDNTGLVLRILEKIFAEI